MNLSDRGNAPFFLILLAGLITLAAGAAGGCKATPPGKWETEAITLAKHSVFVRNKDVRNPLPATSDRIADGKDSFSHYCVACHGLDGQNTGVPFAGTMAPPVPSLASAPVQSYTDGQLKWVIENGIFPSGMPASKGVLSDEEIWSIVLYIRHLPPAGSLGEPAIYGGAASGEANGQASSEANSAANVEPNGKINGEDRDGSRHRNNSHNR
jgi:mono/diheme cytochrome c family protein